MNHIKHQNFNKALRILKQLVSLKKEKNHISCLTLKIKNRGLSYT